MTTTFIIIGVVMTLAAIAFVALPLWFGTRANPQANRREQNLEILRQQAADLEAERKAGSIDEDEYEESRLELERRVLDETKQEQDEKSGKSMVAPRICAAALVVIIPVAASLLYMAYGRYTAMDPQFLALMEEQGARTRGHSASEMTKMLDQMQKDLEADPMNANGWYRLGNTAGQMERFDIAVEAFKKLNALVPNNPDIIADYADMMAAANGRVVTPEVSQLLHKALRLNPNQWKALALLAIDSWDRQMYTDAALYWTRLLKVVPNDFPDRDQIEANIQEATRLAEVNNQISKSSPNASAQAKADADKLEEVKREARARQAVAGDAAPAKQAMPATASAADVRFVAGTVTISADMLKNAGADDTVFIYARPAVGSKMPVAFTKVKVRDLPYKFRLDETMQMAMGADTLGTVEEVIVGARVSKTGNFMPQSGDLEGEAAAPVKVNTDSISVEISAARP